MKSRVLISSFDAATDRLEEYLGAELYDPQERYYIRLDCTDPKLFDLISDETDKTRASKELFQMLHHTYTYKSKKCLLLVGSNKNLSYAVEISFDDNTIQSYQKVINAMYTRYFAFFYEPTFNETSFPIEKVERALEIRNQGEKKGDTVSFHSFLTNYQLWRALNVQPDTTSIKFPLPPMDRFLPCQNAEWNLSKHPSDTLTKLFDECKKHITIRAPQTVAVARFLSVLATAFHQCYQVISSKEDLERYKTLESFRRAANQRATFKTSLRQLSDFLWTEMDQLAEQARITSLGRQLRDLPPTPQRRPTRNTTHVPTQQWNQKWRDDITPTKDIRGRPGEEKRRKAEQHQQRREECIGIVPCIVYTKKRVVCDLCGLPTKFYCSGCRSFLCFQGGEGMGDSKMDRIKKKLRLPPDTTIPKFNKLTNYSRETGERVETQIINSCYHIAHSKKFTSFFCEINNTTNNENDNNDE